MNFASALTLMLGAMLSIGCQAEIAPKIAESPKAPVEGAAIKHITLSGTANLRSLRAEVLESIAQLPPGTELTLDTETSPVFYDYRDANGQVKRSTNGFYPHLLIVSVPAKYSSQFPSERIRQLNQTPGGLYLSSLDVNSALEKGGKISALPATGSPDDVYAKYFHPDGRLKRRVYQDAHRKRFGAQLNRRIDMNSLPRNEQVKWQAIYENLVKAGNRTVDTERRNLFLDSGNTQTDIELAKEYSITFENTGIIQERGAWSIAVLGTAPRHGFGNVPCAEFMSEVIRQAYEKAGYKMSDDFRGKNYLIWSNTAAVVNLTRALHESGWIPWDPVEFKPKTGAIGMHATATWPGHTYMIAGHNGRFIIDNGSPKGRDLYQTQRSSKRDLIGMMYDHGVFFLPPGIIPDRWTDQR